MYRRKIIIMCGVALLVCASSVCFSVTFSLNGPNQTGTKIVVPAGVGFTVSAAMDAPEVGNTFEVFLGYDVSSQSTAGLGGSPTLNKLVLDNLTNVQNSIDPNEFPVWQSAKVATGREDNNTSLDGRPYGLKVVGARYSNTVGGEKTLFSAKFQNNVPQGESYYIVISDKGSGASYTSAWKYGVTSNRTNYALEVYSSFAGDINGDGHVDAADLNLLADNYNASTRIGDFNDDGLVNNDDLGLLATNFGK